MVRLLITLDAEAIVAGATGAVVHVYEGGEDYEVEFLVDGRSKLATVPSEELELIDRA